MVVFSHMLRIRVEGARAGFAASSGAFSPSVRLGQASGGQCWHPGSALSTPFVLFSHIYPWQVFPREVMNFTAENIYKWASENQETLFQWLQPHGGKSLLLNNELKKGPALFLFIPFDPLAESHPLLDEVGLLVVVSWLFFHIWGTNLSSE